MPSSLLLALSILGSAAPPAANALSASAALPAANASSASAAPGALPSGWPGALPSGAASIVNSGSTNLAGYVVHVLPSGGLMPGQGTPALPARVAPALAKRFFADLAAAGPLDRLRGGSCMKSASFGSSTRVAYRGTTSPDLSCPASSAALRALAADATAITDAAGIRPKLRGRRLPP